MENRQNAHETVGKVPRVRIFVPSAAKISMILLPIERLRLEQKIKRFDSPNDLNEIFYADHSGNAVAGLPATKVIAQIVISLREHKS
ncbi:MAG: hypothetical protein VX696_04010 [Pseudomonadota bacterium]|nr:hypothetical protein [Pseudomonadota bacterium]